MQNQIEAKIAEQVAIAQLRALENARQIAIELPESAAAQTALEVATANYESAVARLTQYL